MKEFHQYGAPKCLEKNEKKELEQQIQETEAMVIVADGTKNVRAILLGVTNKNALDWMTQDAKEEPEQQIQETEAMVIVTDGTKDMRAILVGVTNVGVTNIQVEMSPKKHTLDLVQQEQQIQETEAMVIVADGTKDMRPILVGVTNVGVTNIQVEMSPKKHTLDLVQPEQQIQETEAMVIVTDGTKNVRAILVGVTNVGVTNIQVEMSPKKHTLDLVQPEQQIQETEAMVIVTDGTKDMRPILVGVTNVGVTNIQVEMSPKKHTLDLVQPEQQIQETEAMVIVTDGTKDMRPILVGVTNVGVTNIQVEMSPKKHTLDLVQQEQQIQETEAMVIVTDGTKNVRAILVGVTNVGVTNIQVEMSPKKHTLDLVQPEQQIQETEAMVIVTDGTKNVRAILVGVTNVGVTNIQVEMSPKKHTLDLVQPEQQIQETEAMVIVTDGTKNVRVVLVGVTNVGVTNIQVEMSPKKHALDLVQPEQQIQETEAMVIVTDGTKNVRVILVGVTNVGVTNIQVEMSPKKHALDLVQPEQQIQETEAMVIATDGTKNMRPILVGVTNKNTPRPAIQMPETSRCSMPSK